MQETLRHKEAFEQYYVMGNDRSLAKLRKESVSPESPQGVPSLKTLKRWSKAFNWQDRINQRDIEIGRELSAKTDKTVLDTKADYRAEIRAQFSILKKMLNELIKKFKDNQGIEIKDIAGLKDVLGCYERLIRLDLTLVGEVPAGYEAELAGASDKFFNQINDMVKRAKKEEKSKHKNRRKSITKKGGEDK